MQGILILECMLRNCVSTLCEFLLRNENETNSAQGKVIPKQHSMKAYRVVEVKLHGFITSSLK
jgi:hypothetical protein